MKELLEEAKTKYFVNLGNRSLSPVIEASSLMALEYCEKITNNKLDYPVPFFFCFPEKKMASVWLSSILLINFYFEEYINQSSMPTIFGQGDLVEIYGSILKFIRFDGDFALLATKDNAEIYFPNIKLRHLVKIKNRKPNNYDHYKRNKKKIRSDRNTISKIFEPDDSILINPKHLNSKILIIAGRGRTKEIRDSLKNTFIYDECLSEIFQENRNLIIHPDLEVFKNIFSQEKQNQFSSFLTALNKLTNLTHVDKLRDILIELSNLANQESIISEEFDEKFSFCLEHYQEVEERLIFLEKKYPGVQFGDPYDIKAVVINDITQIENFKETIDGFIKKNIPVIFISNRQPEKSSEIEYYQNLFRNNPSYLRLNWNRGKIKELLKDCNESQVYLDHELFVFCKRYASQKVIIEVSQGNRLDSAIGDLQKKFQDLDEFTNLQKSFYSYFYPALYALKNSRSSNKHIKGLIEIFEKEFEIVRRFGIPNQIEGLIKESIIAAKSFEINSKKYLDTDDIFTNILIQQDDNTLFTPCERSKTSLADNKSQCIIFTGFPYREFRGHFLSGSLSKLFVPFIKLLCWPIEAKLTYNYLERRLLAGYFTDYLEGLDHKIPKNLMLLDSSSINSEIEEILSVEGSLLGKNHLPDNADDSINLELEHKQKFNSYLSKNDGETNYVKCDILYFENGCFLFLPHGGKILCEQENGRGDFNVVNSKIEQCAIGLNVFKYKKDRAAFREISRKEDVVKKSFEILDQWKYHLDSLYEKKSKKNIRSLESELLAAKDSLNENDANPNILNISRWLFDSELICPSVSNLKIILKAAEVIDIDQQLKNILEAYKIVTAFTISLSSQIKKAIVKQMTENEQINSNMIIKLNGIEINVERLKINGVEKNNILISYSDTRRIIC
jgi:hypothetical protein